MLLRQANPHSELAAARERWAAQHITTYRIEVEYQRPFNTCQQDFKVEGDTISYKFSDSCTLGAAAVSGSADDKLPTVARLFDQLEHDLNNPACGQNGCVCDGPIEMRVTYDPQRGYPQQIIYELRPDLRWRYLEYWIAQINGGLAQCPPTAYVGQTITVLSLEAAPTPNEPAPSQEKPNKEDKPLSSIGAAINPEVTPETKP
ncbi:MAG: DUF6174 domain-containing protein [Anaerolineae bacterium]